MRLFGDQSVDVEQKFFFQISFDDYLILTLKVVI